MNIGNCSHGNGTLSYSLKLFLLLVCMVLLSTCSPSTDNQAEENTKPTDNEVLDPVHTSSVINTQPVLPSPPPTITPIPTMIPLPMVTLAPTATFVPVAQPANSDCANFVSALHRGDQAMVVGGGANNVRQHPSLTASINGQIPEGGIVDLVDGPQCADGHLWWYVSNSINGWTSEGSAAEGRFLTLYVPPPIDPPPAPPELLPPPTDLPPAPTDPPFVQVEPPSGGEFEIPDDLGLITTSGGQCTGDELLPTDTAQFLSEIGGNWRNRNSASAVEQIGIVTPSYGSSSCSASNLYLTIIPNDFISPIYGRFQETEEGPSAVFVQRSPPISGSYNHLFRVTLVSSGTLRVEGEQKTPSGTINHMDDYFDRDTPLLMSGEYYESCIVGDIRSVNSCFWPNTDDVPMRTGDTYDGEVAITLNEDASTLVYIDTDVPYSYLRVGSSLFSYSEIEDDVRSEIMIQINSETSYYWILQREVTNGSCKGTAIVITCYGTLIGD